MSELAPDAVIPLGKTADWVAVTSEAVWVGSTGPFAVNRIDPATRKRSASILLPGEPCAGLASDSTHLWVPLCGVETSLARIDLDTRRVKLFEVGTVQAEGGVASGAGSVWLIVDALGTLARIDAHTGEVRRRVQVPPGSYNPYFIAGQVWVTHAAGAEVTQVDAATERIVGSAHTGPNPRFLTAAGGYVWTLNQGDGSLTRIDARSRASVTIPLHTPGHGGDLSAGRGFVWTTMAKMPLTGIDAGAPSLRCRWQGPGGDSLGVGFGAIWLTDYHGGTVSRIPLDRVIARCGARQPPR
jgi:streptogramin lyase